MFVVARVAPEDWHSVLAATTLFTEQSISELIMRTICLPAQEYLHECFTYDSSEGTLSWRTRPEKHFTSRATMLRFNTLYAGKTAGSLGNKSSSKPYYNISLDSRKYRLHRIVFKYIYGVDPEIIDHIDGNTLNNTITNLRTCTQLQNNQNVRAYKGRKNKGVYRTKYGTYQACIRKNGNLIYLGTFASEVAAYEAYRLQAITHHKEFVHESV